MKKQQRSIIIIAHNLRSTHNVGSLLRTAEGLGAAEIIFSGYTPYPQLDYDTRLPHITAKLHKQISKTALGAEVSQSWRHRDDIESIIEEFRHSGYTIAALEQTPDSVSLPEYVPPHRLVIILGREAEGLEPEVLALCDLALEIPMYGQKESFNVVQAAAMALYHWRFN